MSKYYYLVAGLPELTLEDSKLSYTVADFKTELYPALSEDDKKLIDLFYLKFDNANVLKLLKDKDAAIDPRGNYSSEELVEYISQLKDGDEVSDSVFPSYLSTFISEYFSLPAEDGFLYEDRLAALYYAYAMESRNQFVSSWFGFNLTLNNILVALTARKFKLDIAPLIVGDTEVCEALRTSNARDFGLGTEVDYLEQLVKISETEELVDREKKQDAGFVTVTYNRDTSFGEIEMLYLLEEYRGQGMGKKLFKMALSCLDINCIRDRKLCVTYGNEAALRLYESFGFYPFTIDCLQKRS